MILSTDVPIMSCGPEDEFSMRISHNFKLHVLLCLKKVDWNREDILLKIYRLGGYRRHKIVKYGTHWSHFLIKFANEQYAREAVDFFKNMNSELTASLVDDLLRAWYYFEKRIICDQNWTHTIVDIVGSTPMSLNFLTENLLNCVFQEFGRPYVLPYTAAISEAHQQVVFTSMTEALAACMAFGEWYVANIKADEFFYRVRINPSSNEETLIQGCAGVPEEAFKLDYFISKTTEINRNAETNRWTGGKQKEIPQNLKRSNSFHNIEAQRVCKQKYDDFRHQQSEAMNFHTPYIFIPFIASIDDPYGQALMAARNPANAGYSFLSLQAVCPRAIGTSSLVETEDEVNRSFNGVYENSGICKFLGNTIRQAQPFADEPPKSQPANVLNPCRSLPPQSNLPRQTPRQKKPFRLSSRIYERRKCNK